MTPAAASAFLAMAGAETLHDAEDWGCVAAARGATEQEVASALQTWANSRADEVQTVESQPEPARCRCSHTHPLHLYGSGRCFNTACGCARFRHKPMPRREDDGDIQQYLRLKGEIQ